MKILVEVTQVDIEEGIASSCTGCPIAKAVRRATGAIYVEVRKAWCVWGEHHAARLPKEATKFIQKFDNGEDVKPFEFELVDVV